MMNRPKRRRSWKLLLVTVVVGLAAGVVYAVAMTMLATYRDPNASQPIVFVPTEVPQRGGQLVPTLDATASDYARLTVPTAGISALVVQLPIVDNTWAVFGLGRNIGHLVGTSPLMGAGNTVLVGHVEMADGSAGVFAGLKQVKPGETMALNWHGEKREYVISTIQVVKPTDVSVLYPTSQEQLTLITCDDYDFMSNSYLQRVVITAPRVA